MHTLMFMNEPVRDVRIGYNPRRLPFRRQGLSVGAVYSTPDESGQLSLLLGMEASL